MTAAADQQLWTRRFLWLLVGVFLFRLVYLFTAIDFQIGGEEPYQWDWGRKLDWCYFSKPPLIGWLMGLLRVTFGYNWWAFRLASLALGTCSLAVMFTLGKRMFDERVGFFAALLFLCTPANAAANFLFSVDSPLVLSWSSALLLFWLAVQRPERSLWWGLLALAIGVGTLAKQMMLVFPLLMLIFALVEPSQRGLLRRGAFWLTILGGLAFLTPMLWWNAQHHGVTFSHMKEHFHHDDVGILGTIGQIVRFPLLQAATYSPITWGVMIAALCWCWKNWKTAGQRERFLFIFSAPALVVFQVQAIWQYINENWPAVYYLSAFALASSWATSLPKREVWMQRGIKLGAGLVIAVYLFLPLIPVLGLTGHKKLDPAQPMRGWPEAGRLLGEIFAKVPHPEKTFVLVLDHRNFASQMAFHLPQHPTVYRWNRELKIESQYEVWPDASDKVGWDCFIIFPDSADDGYKKKGLHHLLREAFEKTEKRGDVNVPIGYGVQRSFQLFLGSNMKHWPEHEAPEPKP